jgi:hypothetical protein
MLLGYQAADAVTTPCGEFGGYETTLHGEGVVKRKR